MPRQLHCSISQSLWDALHARAKTTGQSVSHLVLWSPAYASSIAITGYHLHFISDDRNHAGHVLGASGRDLALALHLEADLHLALPENAAFLQADLSGNPEAALAIAEHATRTLRRWDR